MRVELRAEGKRRRWAIVPLLAAATAWGIGVSTVGTQAFGQAPGGSRAEVPEALDFANGLFRARQFDLAGKEYRKFLATDPAPAFKAEALYGLANTHHFLQEYAEALEAFERFLETAPGDHPSAPTARFRVGELAYVLGDLPKARHALELYTTESAEQRYQELAWPYLGDVRFREGDLDGAKSAYEYTLKSFPGGPLSDRSRLYLGRVLVRQGKRAEALARFRELMDRPGASQRDEALYQVGRLELEAGAFDRSIEAFSRLEQDVPQSPFLSRGRLSKAEALLAVDRIDEAAETLGTLREDPSPELAARAIYLLGLVELKRGRSAEAKVVFNDGVDRFPETSTAPALLFRSAEAAEREGDLDDAMARFERVANDYPGDSWVGDALVQAASIALKRGETDHAEGLARKVIEQGGAGSKVASAMLIEARAALDSDRVDEAIGRFEVLLAREDLDSDPEMLRTARYSLGLALKGAGRTEEAMDRLEPLTNPPGGSFDGEARYLIGQGLFDLGRFEEAIEALRASIELRPEGDAVDHAKARIVLALTELGRIEEAVETLDDLAGRFPESPVLGPTRLRLAEAVLAAEDWNRAERLFQEILDADEGEANGQAIRAKAGLGWALLGAGKPEEAIDAFDSVIAGAEPDDPIVAEASYVKGRALRDLGKPDEAIVAFSIVVEQAPGSPEAPRADLARARLFVELGRPTEAVPIFDALIVNGVENPVEPVDLLLAELGWAFLDAGEVEEADRAFARLLEEHPGSRFAADARLNLAESAFQRGEFAEVVALLGPLTGEGGDEDPEPRVRQAALYREGRAQVEQSAWDEAASAFDRLVEEFPEGSFQREARFWSAEVAFRRGDAASAEERFRAVVDGVPEGQEPESWLPTARLRLVQAVVQQERWADVLSLADSLKQDEPELPQMADLDYARGRALQSQAPPRFDEARQAYQAVIDARKGGELAAMAQFMRGETFFHQKNYEEALREFLMVDVLSSYDDAPKWQALALLEAGKVYEQLDRWADAADIYERLRSRFPDDPAAVEADSRLAAARRKASGEAIGVGSGSGRRG